VELDSEDLRQHYAMLSDEALIAVDRSELIHTAQQAYDQESRSRRLQPGRTGEQTSYYDSDGIGGPKPAWLGDSACAGAFASLPGENAASDAAAARDILEAAGIPWYIEALKVDSESGPQPQYELRLLVPGKFNLEAVSVLDKEIFNAELEAEYRTHFEQLSNEELRAVSPEILLAGLSDRIDRLTRAYTEEIERRKTG
jgi:hypothetical protein